MSPHLCVISVIYSLRSAIQFFNQSQKGTVRLATPIGMYAIPASIKLDAARVDNLRSLIETPLNCLDVVSMQRVVIIQS